MCLGRPYLVFLKPLPDDGEALAQQAQVGRHVHGPAARHAVHAARTRRRRRRPTRHRLHTFIYTTNLNFDS